MRLLLVEDDEQLGAGIRKALMRDGDHVDWLTDGAQALNAIRSESFELIILDLQLPGKDVSRCCRACVAKELVRRY